MTSPKESNKVWVLHIPEWSGSTDIRYMYTEVYTTYTSYLERALYLTGRGFRPIIREVLTNTKYLKETSD